MECKSSAVEQENIRNGNGRPFSRYKVTTVFGKDR